MQFTSLKSRRDFMRYGVRALSTLGAAAAFGQPGLLSAATSAPATDYKALVCIFLFGGMDANNLLIPNGSSATDTRYGYPNYKNVRQNLAIPQTSLLPIQDKITGQSFGLHPSLKPIAGLYAPATGMPRLSLVANVGTLIKPVPHDKTTGLPILNAVPLPVNLFSHSDQQSEWQSGAPQGGFSTGWAGRIADRYFNSNCSAANPMTQQGFPPAIGISGNTLELIGNCTQPTTISGQFGISGNDGSTIGQARIDGLTNMLSLDKGVTLIQAAEASIGGAIQIAKQVGNVPPAAGFPNTGLGQQLAQVASLINAKIGGATRQIYFCSQGGFDTHSDELNQMVNLLGELAGAMAAFDTAIGNMGLLNNVVTFTQSEFNRTFQPNGNSGADHAWGTHTLIMGGSIQGGNVFGTYPDLVLSGPDDSRNRGNWIPTTAVDQYGAALAQWFGLSQQADLNYVFPNLANFTAGSLPIFG